MSAGAWVALAALALNCASTWDSPETEPHHHLVLANDRVRVFDVRVAPHDGTPLYAHDHDHLTVTIGPARMSDIPYHDYVHTMVRELRGGEVEFTENTAVHSEDNIGSAPFHEVVIDFVRPSINVSPCAAPCVFRSDHWAVSSVTLAPSARIVTGEAVIVALSAVNLTQAGPAFSGGPGGVASMHGPIANVGTADARFVLLELK